MFKYLITLMLLVISLNVNALSDYDVPYEHRAECASKSFGNPTASNLNKYDIYSKCLDKYTPDLRKPHVMFYETIFNYNIFAVITGLVGAACVLIGLLAPAVCFIWSILWMYLDDQKELGKNKWLALYDKITKVPEIKWSHDLEIVQALDGFHVKYGTSYIYSHGRHAQDRSDYDTKHHTKESAQRLIDSLDYDKLSDLGLESRLVTDSVPYIFVLFATAMGFFLLTLALQLAFTATIVVASTYGSLVLARSVRRLQKKTKAIIADVLDHKSKSAEEAHGNSESGESKQ